MTGPNLYYMMIYPNPDSPDTATSADFNPFRRRDPNLSAYDSRLISAEAAYLHFVGQGNEASGVMAVTVEECESLGLTIEADPLPANSAHALVKFDAIPNRRNAFRVVALQLKEFANRRGWIYRP
ncbi:MAG: hypothetical protein F4X64_04435 [Chloroflexi bacterium]|nr:hypothetical protein [Chloroflexota bacterium]